MKTIIEFNLPEEKPEYLLYMKSMDYYSSLCQIEEYIKTRLNNDRFEYEETRIALTDIEDMLGDLE